MLATLIDARLIQNMTLTARRSRRDAHNATLAQTIYIVYQPLLSVRIVFQVLQLLREVTLKLQMKAVDVISAYQLLKKVVTTLASLRKDSVTEFKKHAVP